MTNNFDHTQGNVADACGINQGELLDRYYEGMDEGAMGIGSEMIRHAIEGPFNEVEMIYLCWKVGAARGGD